MRDIDWRQKRLKKRDRGIENETERERERGKEREIRGRKRENLEK